VVDHRHGYSIPSCFGIPVWLWRFQCSFGCQIFLAIFFASPWVAVYIIKGFIPLVPPSAASAQAHPPSSTASFPSFVGVLYLVAGGGLGLTFFLSHVGLFSSSGTFFRRTLIASFGMYSMTCKTRHLPLPFHTTAFFTLGFALSVRFVQAQWIAPASLPGTTSAKMCLPILSPSQFLVDTRGGSISSFVMLPSR